MPEPLLANNTYWYGTTNTSQLANLWAYETAGSTQLTTNTWYPTQTVSYTPPISQLQPLSQGVYGGRSQLTHQQPHAVDTAAVQRARELLYEHLDEEQEASYRENLYFETVGSNGTRYRIEWGYAGNVLALNESGRPWRRYCCHPSGYANEDTLLTQKLLLETDEDSFLAIANIDTTPADSASLRLGAEA